MHPYSKNYERRKLENKFISTNWKKMKQLFFSSIYIWFHFHKVENISPMTFFFSKWKKLKWFSLYVYIFVSIYRNWKIFYVLEMIYITSKNIRETNAKCIYLFPRSRKTNQFSVLLYTFDFISQNGKYCTNTFFAQNTNKLIEFFNLYIIYYTQTLSLSCRVKT